MNNYDRIRKQVQSEAIVRLNFGPGNIFIFVYEEVMHGDLKKTIDFMTSEQGGFESKEIKRILDKKRTSRELYCGPRAH